MNLDNKNQYEKLDKGQVAKSIEFLPDQFRQVLEEARLIKIPKEYSKATQIIVNGMGGSNIGTYIIRTALSDQIKAPISIIPGYSVPASVDKNTLYVISSYSGTTEEPLSVYREVKKRGAKIMAITENSPKSKLMKLMLKNDIPGYVFKPQYNPSGQPRLGLGYTIFGIAVMLAKAGFFKIKVRAIEDIIASMEIWTRKLNPLSPKTQNNAKKITLELFDKIPVLVGAEHITGNLHAMRNHINECSKTFAAYLTLPDLNHYAMEGLINPKSNKKNLAFLFFDSNLYDKRVQKRSDLTKQIVKKNGIKVISHKLQSKTRLAQAFELLQLGSWISYYLGISYKVDPAKIPYVDWFKKQLK
ncbi:hypothetical protein DRH27_01240 [Candidatus Falkowbacteria bacterium]|nr:MAG: hypothetical protein DRH27_01240 [Candidatus Falkowbacteria bacterium]